MDSKEYEKNHFGEPVNIYNAEGQLMYIEMVPVSKNSKGKKFAGKDMFSFYINNSGATLDVPVTSVFRLSKDDEVVAEDTI